MAKILVIEDENELRNSITQILTLEGYDVTDAPNGLIGYELAKEKAPNLIISDISMPQMDGYQVLIALRENPKTAAIPLIFLTARAERPFMRHGMELGADDYLPKPFSNAELVAAVRSRLERQADIVESLKDEMVPTRKRLTRIVAHELNTPLSSIMLAQEMMNRHWQSLSTEQIESCLETLNSGSRRLSRIIEQSVLMMKIEAGFLDETVLSEEFQIDVGSMLQKAVATAHRFANQNTDSSVSVVGTVGEHAIPGHLPSLTHALAELITNAMVYSPENSEITVRQQVKGDKVAIVIIDKGQGFTPEQLEQALQPFGQVNRDEYEQQGLGLGLVIAKQIINAHNGELKIASLPGEGTEVTVYLPLKVAQAMVATH